MSQENEKSFGFPMIPSAVPKMHIDWRAATLKYIPNEVIFAKRPDGWKMAHGPLRKKAQKLYYGITDHVRYYWQFIKSGLLSLAIVSATY